MLVARRDPFHSGINEPLPGAGLARHGGGVPRLARAMSVLQIVGTLLAVPVGLGSAYSMYRVNFSVEATCQSLRGNIVGVLDRRVDAGARHMLVRRDIEAFERQCGGVDPDATAAFKELLAADKTVAPATPAAAATLAAAVTPPATAIIRHIEIMPQPVVRKAEPRPQTAEKKPAATVAAANNDAEPVAHDGTDAVWLAAVRSALVRQASVRHEREPARAASAAAVEPPSHAPRRACSANCACPAAAPPAPPAAPALPVATSWTAASAPRPDAEHPVPPKSIPEAAPMQIAASPKPAEAHPRSRFGELVAQIPLLGPAIESIDLGTQ